ncbi:MAG: DUF1465 family protein [Alphaproteobacteria bacterium]|nr:DUF1465 family protein [Alphaproteobacteria bacterium]
MNSLDPAFIQKFYREATELIHASRYYMTHQGKFEMDTLTKSHAEFIEQEMARVAIRMCQVVTWLLNVQDASSNTLLSSDECLQDQEMCMEESTKSPPYPLPEQLHKLLCDSRSLYLRLMRIENL